jgi:glycosyltransferase involved in cell wall biosynthesis
MTKKKIVLVSSVFFPRNSPRSNRTTELAKEFARQGNEVIVYSVLEGYDYSQFEKEHNVSVKNIGKMSFLTLSSDGAKRISFFLKIMILLFNKLFQFPNIELMFKVPKALKKENNIDLLLSVAIPYPVHWGVALFKKNNKSNFAKTWVADCGDPFMGNKFNKHPFYFKYLEKWFCKEADYLTIPIDEAKDAYYPEFHEKIKIIPQGFRFDEFKLTDWSGNNEVLTFVYAGAFYKGMRDPQLFLKYLGELDVPFKFIIYTKHISLVEPYLDTLGGKIEIRDYIPRSELLQEMCKADFLVNFENGTSVQSPSKLIDYALVNKPILSVASNKLDKMSINQFLNKNYSTKLVMNDIEKFNIVNVVDAFVKLIKE